MNGKAQFTHKERCVGCFGCFQICPKKAILDQKETLRTIPQYQFNENQLGDTDKFVLKSDLGNKYE